MESVNNSSKEFSKVVWTTVAAVSCLIAVWKSLSIAQVVVVALLK